MASAALALSATLANLTLRFAFYHRGVHFRKRYHSPERSRGHLQSTVLEVISESDTGLEELTRMLVLGFRWRSRRTTPRWRRCFDAVISARTSLNHRTKSKELAPNIEGGVNAAG
jgi:hypothetical protein